jgi:hypothetical protein
MPNLGKRFGGNGDMRGFWDLNEAGADFSTGLIRLLSTHLVRCHGARRRSLNRTDTRHSGLSVETGPSAPKRSRVSPHGAGAHYDLGERLE